MTNVCRVFVLIVASCPAWAFANGGCEPAKRISDEEAIKVAIAELGKRVVNLDSTKYSFSVSEEACDLRVTIENKNELRTGRHSFLVLGRGGQVKRYFGGM